MIQVSNELNPIFLRNFAGNLCAVDRSKIQEDFVIKSVNTRTRSLKWTKDQMFATR